MEDFTLNFNQQAFSRQLATYGHFTQQKLSTFRIFISGINGLGIQVAKNLILSGPKQVVIYDDRFVTLRDLGSNFYCRQEDIGIKTRAEASLSLLKQLNPSICVDLATDSSIQYISSNFECAVIIDNYDKQYLIELDKAMRAKGQGNGFILAGSLGLYGYIFVDFGNHHRILDQNGQQCKINHIAKITQEQRGLVILHQNHSHGLHDNDTVVFSQVKGMQQINGRSYKIEVVSSNTFRIGNTRQFNTYIDGGIVKQIKIPYEISFLDLQQSLQLPQLPNKEISIIQSQSSNSHQQWHVILNCIYKFFHRYQRLPKILNQQDANQLKNIVRQYENNHKQKLNKNSSNSYIQINQSLIKNISFFASTQISPCCSFFGGIVTQQIIKLTGKYVPLNQWFHHHFFEILPQRQIIRSIVDNRYHDYHVIFGDQFMQKIENSKSFLIGAGALGCQFIKMLSLMGLGSNHGLLAVADDDNVQISDLHRQFMFRQEHIGLNKSQIACKKGKIINKSINLQPFNFRVDKQSQQIFDENFWNNMDFIISAVDSTKSRSHIDNQCVWYEKPFFESGTFGTKGHSQVIIPFQTISYSDVVDIQQQSIPLKNNYSFPYKIQHTILSAKKYFDQNFAETSSYLQKFFQLHKIFLEQLQKQNKNNPFYLKKKLQNLRKLLFAYLNHSYEICIQLAVDIFQETFNQKIKRFLIWFPVDHITQQGPYWRGLKRTPSPLELNLQDPLHLQFIQSAANIYSNIIKIPILASKEQILKHINKIKIISSQMKKQQYQKDNDEQQIQILLKQLSSFKINTLSKPKVINFQKDDPYHIKFIGGFANLTARIYRIQEVDNFKIKLIAAKIVPAIITTTASTVGLVGIQIIKYLLAKKNYRNSTLNLALPLLIYHEPIQPIINEDQLFDPMMCGPTRVIPGKFTKWDKINIKGPMTIQQLKDYFEKIYKVEIHMIYFGATELYFSFINKDMNLMQIKIPEAIEIKTKKNVLNKRYLCLGLAGNTIEGIDCIFPDIKYEI